MTSSPKLTRRNAVCLATAAAAGLPTTSRRASAVDTTGVTATEIKIGHTNPYSGPASSYSSSGKLEMAFFNQMVNDQGGVAGRKINFISYDDQYSPPKTVEQVRRLIEEDKVAFLRDYCESRDLSMNQVVAIGDGRSDLPMFDAAGFSVGLNASPAARAAASVSVDSHSFLDALRAVPGLLND